MTLPVRPAVRADARQAHARHAAAAATCSYEPKWDGFRCVVFRDGDDLDLQIRNQKPLLRYFPELREPLLAQLPDRVVLDGELVISNDDAVSTSTRSSCASTRPTSRVQKLAVEIPASFVAFDILALGDDSLLDAPFARAARERSRRCSRKAKPPLLPHARDRRPRRRRRLVQAFRRRGLRRRRRQAARRARTNPASARC